MSRTPASMPMTRKGRTGKTEVLRWPKTVCAISRIMMTTRIPSIAATTEFENSFPYRRKLTAVCTSTMPATNKRLPTIAYSTPTMIHLTSWSALEKWVVGVVGDSATSKRYGNNEPPAGGDLWRPDRHRPPPILHAQVASRAAGRPLCPIYCSETAQSAVQGVGDPKSARSRLLHTSQRTRCRLPHRGTAVGLELCIPCSPSGNGGSRLRYARWRDWPGWASDAKGGLGRRTRSCHR